MHEALRGKEKEWAEIAAKAWVDGDFKARLTAEPETVLGENGIDMPPGTKVNIVETKDDENTIPLPAMPSNVQGSVDEPTESVQANCCMIAGGCQ